MDVLLQLLRAMPEFCQLKESIDARRTAAVSGVSQIVRSHFIAALCAETGRPALVVCQDELAVSRMQDELAAFLGARPPVLPGRELTLLDAAGVSREWEQKRLQLLYELAMGRVPVLIASLDALCLRTMPRDVLCGAAIRLAPGMCCEPEALVTKLDAAGYTRASLVEGVGQYALRGGIVDVFSPAHEKPLRVEFFGDELDAMGFFDPITQRRTENADEAVLLPVAESVPALHPGGISGLCEDIRALLARQKRRKTPNAALLKTLENDLERLENGVSFACADRYLAFLYPEFATAASYISRDAAVFFCDHGNLARAADARQDALGQAIEGYLATGVLSSDQCDFSCTFDELAGQFTAQGAVYFDSFLAARYPETLPPKRLLSVTARQLPGYGGSMDTAVQDLQHYIKSGYGCMVLCGGRRRGEILKDMLAAKGVNALLAMPATRLPQPEQVLITDAALPAGLEYPTLRLAVLTEGQIMARAP